MNKKELRDREAVVRFLQALATCACQDCNYDVADRIRMYIESYEQGDGSMEDIAGMLYNIGWGDE